MPSISRLDRDRLKLELRRASGPSLWLLGLSVVSAACLLVILANIGVRLPWQDAYRTKIAVDDVAGVVPEKQTVRLAGVEVGRIDDVELVDGRAIVTVALDPERGPLYKDARLRLRPETPLEDLFLNIEDRGTPAAGELGEDDVLPAERTRTAVDVGRVLDVFNGETRVRVEQAIDELGRGLGPRGDAFRQTLVELAPFLAAARRLTHETATRRTQTARLIHNFRLLTEELGDRERSLRTLVRGGASSLGELGRNEGAVREVLAELPPTMAQLESSFATLRRTTDELDPAFEALRPVAAALPGGLRALESFGAAAGPSFAALDRPLPAVRTLLTALRPTARGLRRAFDELAPVPGRLDAVTKLIGPCEEELAKFFHNTNSLGKFAHRHSVILRGQAVVGTNSAAGQVNDPNQTAAPSCAPGGPGR